MNKKILNICRVFPPIVSFIMFIAASDNAVESAFFGMLMINSCYFSVICMATMACAVFPVQVERLREQEYMKEFFIFFSLLDWDDKSMKIASAKLMLVFLFSLIVFAWGVDIRLIVRGILLK